MKETKAIILSAAFLYLFLIPFFFHPDIKIIYYLSQFLTQDKIVNIYQFITLHPDKSLLGSFVYPPLAYFFFAIIFPLIKFLAGNGFITWLGMGNDAVAVPHIFRFLFLIKFPLVLVHLFSALSLAQLTGDQKQKKLLVSIWLFNPISIYVIALMGQFDVLPVYLTILSLVWAQKKPTLSVLALGIGAALKTYPLLLIPFVAILTTRKWTTTLKLLIFGLLPYVISILPFITTPAFWTNSFASGLSQRIFHLSFSLGFTEQILIVPAILFGLLLLAFYRDRGQSQKLWQYFLAVTLIPIAGSHFHPQWLLWSIPFLAIFLAKTRSWLLVGIFFASSFATILLFNDKFLTWGLLSPLDSGLLFLPPLSSLLTETIPFQSLFHTIFFVASLWIVKSAYKYE